jgi:hypothetical protein
MNLIPWLSQRSSSALRVKSVSPRSVRPFYIQRVFLAKCLRIFKPVETLELNPAHLFSKPVGSSLIFGEPAVRFHLIVEVPVQMLYPAIWQRSGRNLVAKARGQSAEEERAVTA